MRLSCHSPWIHLVARSGIFLDGGRGFGNAFRLIPLSGEFDCAWHSFRLRRAFYRGGPVAVFTASAVGPGAGLEPVPGCVGTQTPTQGIHMASHPVFTGWEPCAAPAQGSHLHRIDANGRAVQRSAPGGSSWNGRTRSPGLWANGSCGVGRFHQGRDRYLHGTGRSSVRAPRSPTVRLDCQFGSKFGCRILDSP